MPLHRAIPTSMTRSASLWPVRRDGRSRHRSTTSSPLGQVLSNGSEWRVFVRLAAGLCSLLVLCRSRHTAHPLIALVRS
eukprot:scaffold210859_cov27-Tisochrysis_lutea.AAC.4